MPHGPHSSPQTGLGKSRTGIRRPLGPATDGSGDPSSDGLIDTRALTARKKPRVHVRKVMESIRQSLV
jgi:hypothetical protein